MRLINLGRGALTAMLTFVAIPALAAPNDGATARPPAFSWVDLSACIPPKLSPPRLPREGELIPNAQRRFLDLDRNGRCMVMDVWLERLASIPNSVSRNLEHRFYRFDGKRWDKFFASELSYYPYALESSDGTTFFIVAATSDDVGDPILLGDAEPKVYRSAPGRKGLFGADGASLSVYQGDTRAVLRALAQQLSDRFGSGQLAEPQFLTVPEVGRARLERERIEMILKAAQGAASSPVRR